MKNIDKSTLNNKEKIREYKKEYEDTFKNFRVAYNHVPVYNTQNREK